MEYAEIIWTAAKSFLESKNIFEEFGDTIKTVSKQNNDAKVNISKNESLCKVVCTALVTLPAAYVAAKKINKNNDVKKRNEEVR